MQPSGGVVNLGGRAVLYCEFSSPQPIELHWLHDGGVMMKSKFWGSLHERNTEKIKGKIIIVQPIDHVE